MMEEGTSKSSSSVGGGGGGRFWLLMFSVIICLITKNNTVKSEIIKYFEISENTPAGSRIGFIDADSPPYLIVPVPGSPVTTDLIVDPSSGEIRTKVALDRETTPSYSLVALTQNIRIVIKVLDENDNAPVFPVDNIVIEYPENSPRDTKRALPPAKDPDLGLYSTQKYDIISGNNDDVFKLSQQRGRDGVLYLDLQNSGILDRELCGYYDLVIEAIDGGIPGLRTHLNVNITILDVNDNPPIFNQTRYTVSIPENSTIGTSIIRVNATDADIGLNGKIEYSINRRQSDRDEIFKINEKTGIIYVNKLLDFETKDNHEVVIVARDLGVQPLETTVFLTVYITDVNDNKPMINVIFLSDDATPKISESAKPGEFIARISISDPDLKNEYSNANVTLIGGDGNFGLTTRDNIIYLVVIERQLDREIKSYYDLSVEATDTGTPPLRALRTFKLIVTDINDNPPIFSQLKYDVHLNEAAEPGTQILRVKANDYDELDNSIVKYYFDNSTIINNWFVIDEDSGIIKTNSIINCETDPTPVIIVIAKDMGKPSLSSSAIVHITIHDLNDNEPIFDKPLYNVTVPEDLPIGHCFLKVKATDPDCGVNSIVNYTLSTSAGKLAIDQVLIRSDTGEICVRSSLDHEISPYLELPVIATDRGGLSSTAIVRIKITDVNDNRPVFKPSEYNTTINIDNTLSQIGTIIHVIATDDDDGIFGQIGYHITSGNEGGIFRIDRVTGQLQIARTNLLSRSSIHQLNITAIDAAGLKSINDAIIRITISTKSSTSFGQLLIPSCQKSRYNFIVKENSLQNSIIGSVNEKITTESTSGKQASKFFLATGETEFSIDSNSGVIRTRISFDRELIDNYVLSIGLKNDFGIGYCQVEVNIEDINDNPPSFTSSTVRISIPESQALDTPLYVAYAIDPDVTPSSIPIRYVILQDSSNDLFGINSHNGDIYLLRKLDYEVQQRHSLFISCIDGGGLSTNQTINIEVQDVNDNPPVFERNEYNVEISEATKINSQVLQVTALDLDTGNNARISYRIHGSQYFRITETTGWIYLIQNLDRETTDHYKLTVLATDNGSPVATASCLIFIKILDYNDNSPVFEKDFYTFNLLENLPPNTIIGSVTAKDIDIGKNSKLKYTIIQQNSSFNINSDTGELSTRESLDRELKIFYDIVIEAKDQGIPSKSSRVNLRINIEDVNDNSPDIIDPQGNIVSVREEQPIGTEVARVRAIDNDYGENGTITYSILKDRDSNGWNVFTIDKITGIIRTKIILDHEERDIYRVSVQASDNGNPSRNSVRAFRIEVLGISDNRPTFKSTSLTYYVYENVTIGYSIGTLTDTGSIGHVAYTLDMLTPLNTLMSQYSVFDVDTSTGQLVVSNLLDRELINEYQLKIRALDTTSIGNPQSIAVSVKIIINDVNDNYPVWKEDPIIIRVVENTIIGTTIFNLTASDLDSGLNGELRYELLSELPSVSSFSVDSLTGALTIIRPLDREEISDYTLILRASDCAEIPSERLSSTVTVKIIVLDENDNDPYFVSSDDDDDNNKISLTNSILPGTVIFRVIAIDNDADDNGRVSYIITSGNEESKFSIDYDTGLITLVRTILKDTVIEVTASDHGVPARHTTMKLFLTIIEGHVDGPPRLLVNNPIVHVSEYLAAGGSVINVAAPVLNDHVNVSFHVSPAFTDKFTISSTGLVTLTRPLDRESSAIYYVPIVAKSNKLLDQTIVKIEVDDENDNSPVFRAGSCYTLAVPENQNISIIHTITAVDYDDGKNGDISYSIVGGNVGNKFQLDSKTGHLSSSNLDRELLSTYILSVSAKDNGRPSLESRCNITIRVIDVNDNSPIFSESKRNDANNSQINTNDYPLFRQLGNSYFNSLSSKYMATVSENSPVDSSVMTIRAVDSDQGVNGKITYSIAEEINWHFRIDNLTGLITTAGPLDRERQEKYNFLVIATDGGLSEVKNTSVQVEINISDVNDNSPVFIDNPLRRRIPASFQPGQNIATITAFDPDIGVNGEIIYSLSSKENDKLKKFNINPITGELTTTNSLLQDSGKTYHLEVIASDKGNPSKSTSGFIELIISDDDNQLPMLKFQNNTYNVIVQENSPIGMDLIKVTAVRTDGRRQRILYSISSGNYFDTFTIDENTGTLKINNPSKLDAELWLNYTADLSNNSLAFEELSHNWQIIMENQDLLDNQLRNEASKRILTLVARTTGAEPLEAYTKVVIYVSDVNDNPPIFTQTQYSATVPEGNPKDNFVVKLTAVDNDQGINSKILYHIVDGNPDNAFTINPPYSGIVRTNIVLDREIKEKYRLTVIATDQGNPQLTGTTALSIRVIDINDNQPTFPGHNVIAVSEGSGVGSVLTSITANDVDSSPALTYRIGNTNDFGPFSIDRYGGKVTLTGPLDAEEENEYVLQVMASDGIHQVTTDLTIRVNDVNDNAPKFHQSVYITTLSDGQSGSIGDLQEVITVNATDADILEKNRQINFNLQQSTKGFSIDSQTGTIMVNRTALTRPLPKEIELIIVAKDSGKPELSSTCLVIVRLNHLEYSSVVSKEFKININENIKRGTVIVKLNDLGLIDGGILSNDDNDDDDGTFEISRDNLIVIKDLDREKQDKYVIKVGTKSSEKSSLTIQDSLLSEDSVVVTIIVNDINDNYPIFTDDLHEITIKEDTKIESLIIKLNTSDNDCPDSPASKIIYNITSGNDAGLFKIDELTGELRVNSTLDCDLKPDNYSIIILACDNDEKIKLCTMKKLKIHLDGVNDNSPKFPVTEYIEFVGENEPIGTRIVSARASDIDSGIFGNINYTIHSAASSNSSEYENDLIDDSWKLFKIDNTNGLITTNAIFDYEQRNRYVFLLRATDSGGKYTQINIKIEIDSRDEYYPQFTERMYRFILLNGINTKIGTIIGNVRATDRDKGPDGRIVYQLTSQHQYLKLNRTTGELILKKKLTYDSIEDFTRLIISASSGRQGSLSNMTVVEVRLIDNEENNNNNLYGIDANLLSTNGNYNTNITSTTKSSSIGEWIMILFLLLLLSSLLIFAIYYYLYMNNCNNKKSKNNKSGLTNDGNNQASSNSYVDPSAFDTIPIRNINNNSNNINNNNNNNNNSLMASSSVTNVGIVGNNNCKFTTTNLPPKYDEIPAYSTSRSINVRHEQRRHHPPHPTSSELSESEQSGSSGRGSAEDDGDDEEIRMINEAGQTTGDSSSDISVHNTQEYLARLGIVDNPSSSTISHRPQEALPIDSMHLFDDDNVTDADITTLIYGKINNNCDNSTHEQSEIDSIPGGGIPSINGSLSSIVHSEEELIGSYNWDYLLDWGPQYQPLAHVFGEIARLKDDNGSIKSSSTTSGGGNNNNIRLKKNNNNNKPLPPPLLTSIAPRLIAAPALSRVILPRSPISHDLSIYPSAALSPSFSPSLSPLATKSSSISPLEERSYRGEML